MMSDDSRNKRRKGDSNSGKNKKKSEKKYDKIDYLSNLACYVWLLFE